MLEGVIQFPSPSSSSSELRKRSFIDCSRCAAGEAGKNSASLSLSLSFSALMLGISVGGADQSFVALVLRETRDEAVRNEGGG